MDTILVTLNPLIDGKDFHAAGLAQSPEEKPADLTGMFIW